MVLLGLKAFSHAWTLRPHLPALSLLLLAGFFLEKIPSRKKTDILGWLGICFLWANMHASWILAPIMLLLRLVFSQNGKKFLTMMFFLTLGVICINPNGLALLAYPFSYAPGSHHQVFIAEWKPPRLSTESFFWIYTVILYGTFLFRPGWKKAENLFAVFLTMLALSSRRYIPFFVVGTILLFSNRVEEILRARGGEIWDRFRRHCEKLEELWTGGSAIPLVIIAIVFIMCWVRFLPYPVIQKNMYPEETVNYMKRHKIKGSVFNEYRYGGYIIWSLYPSVRPYIDGRADLHSREFFERYEKALYLRNIGNQKLGEIFPQTDWIFIDSSRPLAYILEQRYPEFIIHRQPGAVLARNPFK